GRSARRTRTAPGYYALGYRAPGHRARGHRRRRGRPARRGPRATWLPGHRTADVLGQRGSGVAPEHPPPATSPAPSTSPTTRTGPLRYLPRAHLPRVVPADRRSLQAWTTRAAMPASASLPHVRGSYAFLLPTSPSTLSTPS